ncbi:hypothetical protein JMJ99_11100 [Companilactobacillus zhachilii]|uniref:hypothetical protein n=1 Tax=Companilactobacillus zhachilii TaxID=2304606 RepID=UPI00192148AD|nr:hypothetical protein [Companilactobacillus zhachilii]MBL3531918.1 hypothetical protein [Companilactobacillus zhachilii]
MSYMPNMISWGVPFNLLGLIILEDFSLSPTMRKVRDHFFNSSKLSKRLYFLAMQVITFVMIVYIPYFYQILIFLMALSVTFDISKLST